MDALKLGGGTRIHPYVLAKMRDDPSLLRVAEPAVRRNILDQWSASKLAAMPTGEIESVLARLGVPYDQAAFIRQARAGQSAWDVGGAWEGALRVDLGVAFRDFLNLAACELWRRLCPEQPSLEMMDDWLCEGYGLVELKRPAEALAAWAKFWRALRALLTPELGSLMEAEDQLYPRMSQCLANWVQDFSMAAMNGCGADPRCGEIGLRFLRELVEAFPGNPDNPTLRADAATIRFQMGQGAEAEAECLRLIQEYPDHAVGYATLSDGLLINAHEGTVEAATVRRAIQLLEQAAAIPVKDAARFDLESRLNLARQYESVASGKNH